MISGFDHIPWSFDHIPGSRSIDISYAEVVPMKKVGFLSICFLVLLIFNSCRINTKEVSNEIVTEDVTIESNMEDDHTGIDYKETIVELIQHSVSEFVDEVYGIKLVSDITENIQDSFQRAFHYYKNSDSLILLEDGTMVITR